MEEFNIFKTKQVYKKLYYNLALSPTENLNEDFSNLDQRFVRIKGSPDTYYFCFVKNDFIYLNCELGPHDFKPLKSIHFRAQKATGYILDISMKKLTGLGMQKFLASIRLILEHYAYKEQFEYDRFDALEMQIASPIYSRDLRIVIP